MSKTEYFDAMTQMSASLDIGLGERVPEKDVMALKHRDSPQTRTNNHTHTTTHKHLGEGGGGGGVRGGEWWLVVCFLLGRLFFFVFE